MSPELIDPRRFGLNGSLPTKKSDCYALGMVIYEVLSGQAPFAQWEGPIVIRKAMNGERPGRPQWDEGKLFTDAMWRMVELCWKARPDDRISAKAVLLGLEGNPPPMKPTSNAGGDVQNGSTFPLFHLGLTLIILAAHRTANHPRCERTPGPTTPSLSRCNGPGSQYALLASCPRLTFNYLHNVDPPAEHGGNDLPAPPRGDAIPSTFSPFRLHSDCVPEADDTSNRHQPTKQLASRSCGAV